jgi:hypothetical protein
MGDALGSLPWTSKFLCGLLGDLLIGIATPKRRS